MIINLFLFWRIGLTIVGYLGSLAFPKVANGGFNSYWTSWAQWDGGHYFDIAKKGYLRDSDYAFFPLFPTLTRLISKLTSDNIILSGLIISSVAFLLFLIVFFNYVAKSSHKKIAINSITTFLVFPTTFYMVAFYSESLFLLFSVTTFLFLRSRKYLLAAIFTSLASTTRLVGIFLVLSLFYSYFAHLKFNVAKTNRKIFYLIVSLFGFSIYATYLWYKLNEPFRFLTVQTIWNRTITDPISTILSYVWAYLVREPRPLNDFFDLITTIIFLCILALGRKKITSSLWIFSTLVILIPASSGTLTSMPRYVLSSLGAFIIVGKYLEEKPILKIPLWAISLAAQAFLLVRFVNGYWVA